LSELTAHMEQLEKELGMLRAERDHVRERVERLLGNWMRNWRIATRLGR
jgi:chaperonin cofactor prefoldin